jgi:hypothetical protein
MRDSSVALQNRAERVERAAAISEDVTLFKIRELFASNLNVFSDGFCEKSKKSQPLRMTPQAVRRTSE